MNAGLNHAQELVKNHVYVRNAKTALRTMWNDSFNKDGTVRRELAAWELDNGAYMIDYDPRNTTHESFLTVKTYSKGGDLYVKYNGKFIKINSRVHTHPNIGVNNSIGISDQDINVYNSQLKYNNLGMKIIYNRSVYQMTGPSKTDYVKLGIMF